MFLISRVKERETDGQSGEEHCIVSLSLVAEFPFDCRSFAGKQLRIFLPSKEPNRPSLISLSPSLFVSADDDLFGMWIEFTITNGTFDGHVDDDDDDSHKKSIRTAAVHSLVFVAPPHPSITMKGRGWERWRIIAKIGNFNLKN